MSTLANLSAKADALGAVVLTPIEAGRFTTLSPKTLERHALAGEPLGRIKIGRRVMYLRAALESWLASKVVSQTPTH